MESSERNIQQALSHMWFVLSGDADRRGDYATGSEFYQQACEHHNASLEAHSGITFNQEW